MSEDPQRAPFVTLSRAGLRVHLPHGDGFMAFDLTAENATKLVTATVEKLTKLKGQGVAVELLAWLMK